MNIEDIKHLAELSKLKFTDEELQNFSSEFESLVGLADIIKNANIDGETKINKIDLKDLREDVSKPSTPVDVLLMNAPESKKDSIVVPRIME